MAFLVAYRGVPLRAHWLRLGSVKSTAGSTTTYLPGWDFDDPSYVDFSWEHPYPRGAGFGDIPPDLRP